MAFDIAAYGTGSGLVQAISLAHDLLHELVASGQELRQHTPLLGWLHGRRKLQAPAQLGKHAGIDPIGLCQHAGRPVRTPVPAGD